MLGCPLFVTKSSCLIYKLRSLDTGILHINFNHPCRLNNFCFVTIVKMHFCIISTYISSTGFGSPSNCPFTVPSRVFIHQPRTPKTFACFSVCFLKKTPVNIKRFIDEFIFNTIFILSNHLYLIFTLDNSEHFKIARH